MPAVNHAALLYFLHLQATYTQLLSDLFHRAALRPIRPREGRVATVTSRCTREFEAKI